MKIIETIGKLLDSMTGAGSSAVSRGKHFLLVAIAVLVASLTLWAGTLLRTVAGLFAAGQMDLETGANLLPVVKWGTALTVLLYFMLFGSRILLSVPKGILEFVDNAVGKDLTDLEKGFIQPIQRTIRKFIIPLTFGMAGYVTARIIAGVYAPMVTIVGMIYVIVLLATVVGHTLAEMRTEVTTAGDDGFPKNKIELVSVVRGKRSLILCSLWTAGAVLICLNALSVQHRINAECAPGGSMAGVANCEEQLLTYEHKLKVNPLFAEEQAQIRRAMGEKVTVGDYTAAVLEQLDAGVSKIGDRFRNGDIWERVIFFIALALALTLLWRLGGVIATSIGKVTKFFLGEWFHLAPAEAKKK